MTDRICKICQKPFQGRPNKIYCTIQCRRQAEFARRVEKCRERLLAQGWDLPAFDAKDWPGWDEPLADASGWPPLTDWPD